MRMKQFIITLVMGLFYQTIAHSQGIEFMDNRPIAEVLAKAKAEGKLVFVDCYTSWCGPCKVLAQDVFPQQQVGDFFNPRFVSLKLDMEKGEGPTMAKRWDVGAYPTLTFLDAEGEVLFQTVGARDARHLVDTVAYLLENYQPTELARRYKAGERSAQLVADYIIELQQQRKRNTIETVASEFITTYHEQILTDTLVQKILTDYVRNPYNEGFLYAYEHRHQLPSKVTEAMEFTWRLYTKSFYLIGQGNSLGLDEQGMQAYYNFMQQKGVEHAQEYYYSYKLPASFLMKDKRMILECLNGCRNLPKIPKGQIDMAFNALEELELTATERQQYDDLKQYYSQIVKSKEQ